MSTTLKEVPALPIAPDDIDGPENEAGTAGAAADGGPDAEPEPEPEPEPKPPRLLQDPLPGDWSAIGSEFGGVAPDRSEIRLLGGKMPIEGSFPKGTEIDLLVRVRVTGVLGQDLEDAYGTRGGTVRRHLARMVSVRRATP